MITSAERVLVIRNPASSHAAEVGRCVMDRLHEGLMSSQIAELWTPSAKRSETTDAIASAIQPGDTVLVAAGDGTGNAVVNAYLQASQPGTRIGFLPYGNFNDMATTFTDEAARRDPLRLLQTTTEVVRARPLEVIKNGEHERYALLYATLGWTASAAALFDDPTARRDLQSGKANLASSLMKMGTMYFRTRHSCALPPFYRDGDTTLHEQTTDVLAVNGPIMAKIIRSHEAFYRQVGFFSKDLDVSTITRNVPFLGKSAINFALGTTLILPGRRVSHDTMHFTDATIPLQLDGESMSLSEVETLSIVKDPTAHAPVVHVLQTTEQDY